MDQWLWATWTLLWKPSESQELNVLWLWPFTSEPTSCPVFSRHRGWTLRRCCICCCCPRELCPHPVLWKPHRLHPNEGWHCCWHSHSSGPGLGQWRWLWPGIPHTHKHTLLFTCRTCYHRQIEIIILRQLSPSSHQLKFQRTRSAYKCYFKRGMSVRKCSLNLRVWLCVSVYPVVKILFFPLMTQLKGSGLSQSASEEGWHCILTPCLMFSGSGALENVVFS